MKLKYKNMKNKLPDGAQFLVIRGAEHKKVTAFMGIPIELNDLTAINRDEATFLQEGRSGFMLTNATEKDASIKFLNTNIEKITINLGESKDVFIDNNELKIELWAVRVNSEAWDKWRISF